MSCSGRKSFGGAARSASELQGGGVVGRRGK